MKTATKPVTMADIARKIGVSQQAVSGVMNRKSSSRVSAETREKILAAARELKFQPNLMAKSLKNGKTGTIGFLGERLPLDAPTAVLNSVVAAGIEEALPEDNVLVILSANSSRGLDNSLRLARQGMVDGLIVNAFPMHYEELEQRIVPELRDMGLPFVVTHPTAQPFDFPNIGVNREAAGYLMAVDFINKGITAIDVFIPWPDRLQAMAQYDGVRRALVEHGHEGDSIHILDRKVLGTAEFVKSVSDRAEQGVGIVFPSVQAAHAAHHILLEQGLRVPQEVQLAVFGSPHGLDFDFPAMLCGYSLAEQGACAVRLLTEALESGADNGTGGTVVLEPEMYVK